MTTPPTALSPARANLVLATLFLGMFVLGSGELLVVGVLDRIAADLHVTIAEAGTVVTVYALGLAIGGPALTALTIRVEKRTVLIGTVGLFIACNLAAVLTDRLVLALVTVAVAWGTSHLEPPVVEEATPADAPSASEPARPA